jgi:hypothetical protein
MSQSMEHGAWSMVKCLRFMKNCRKELLLITFMICYCFFYFLKMKI